jgi:hypothetical protein
MTLTKPFSVPLVVSCFSAATPSCWKWRANPSGLGARGKQTPKPAYRRRRSFRTSRHLRAALQFNICVGSYARRLGIYSCAEGGSSRADQTLLLLPVSLCKTSAPLPQPEDTHRPADSFLSHPEQSVGAIISKVFQRCLQIGQTIVLDDCDLSTGNTSGDLDRESIFLPRDQLRCCGILASSQRAECIWHCHIWRTDTID